MKAWALRLTGAGLLIVLGMAIGTWATTHHFRPLLDDQQDLATQCAAARDNLAGLAQEQGKALGALTLAANERQALAKQAVDEAAASAQGDFAAANRLQQERTGGDQCAAATSIIDQELGL
ncbi:hypothetical protein [Pseudomonas mosselii]|uniref:hypothetical protein n=1 Tax=Pseudomonas mosselii TaxID=78327 RepID=UPI001E532172|nr:hypothetical protein [Pseudomonas mosselii]MCL8300503.1 hypothetical protein [Pseudomonas mosselii]MCL8343257.1 hypothetical protein [Pseudomonas mosselii]WJR27760.1 hypothetical protein LU678_025945 [Pseudomonas mosselii]